MPASYASCSTRSSVKAARSRKSPAPPLVRGGALGRIRTCDTALGGTDNPTDTVLTCTFTPPIDLQDAR